MEREEFLHFDSLNATSKSTDVFHATFNLQKTYTKIKNIHIKNVELPICFPNIRSSNLSNNLQFTINSVNYSTTITERNYTTIGALLTDLNTAISTTLTSSGFTLVLSTGIKNNLIVTMTGALTNLTIRNTTLSIILGLNGATTGSLTYTSANSFNINYDLYVLMSFDNIPSIFSSSGNIRSALKIPLGTNYANINNYFSHRSDNDMSLIVYDENFIFQNLQIKFYDRFGYLLSNNNVDYSFTISLIYSL
jgi:hypothetical protein